MISKIKTPRCRSAASDNSAQVLIPNRSASIEWREAWNGGMGELVAGRLSNDVSEALRLTGLSYLTWIGTDAHERYISARSLLAFCAQLSEPIARPAVGIAKFVYFPARGEYSEVLLFGLVFLTFLLRLSGYTGAVAWISFPTELLDDRRFNEICNLLSAAERVRRTAYKQAVGVMDLPFRIGSSGRPSGPIQVASAKLPFRGAAAETAVFIPPAATQAEHLPFFIGCRCPFDLTDKHTANSRIAVRYGVPMICIPARTVSTIQITRSRWMSAFNLVEGA
jgi:hypothetical protein